MQQIERKRRCSGATVLPAVVMLSFLTVAVPGPAGAQDARDASALIETAGTIASGSTGAGTDVGAETNDKLVPTGEFVSLEGSYPIILGGPMAGAEFETSGDMLDLGSVRRKLVLLDFWASWCRPCIEEIPETNAFAAEFGGRDDFVFISVNQDAVTSGGDAASVRDFIHARGIKYPGLIDQAAPSLKKKFAIRAWLTRIMISPDGEIFERPAGRLTLAAAAEYLRSR